MSPNTTQSPSRYTITAALPYANGPIHIGHLAGVYIPADIYARYLRSCQQDILFVSGSDEHGVPITIRAQQEGITCQQVVDKYHQLNKETLADLGISFDIFSRTSSPTHHATASAFFTTLHHKNCLTTQETNQYYDVSSDQFLADRYIYGTCPQCNYADAYGDQCEKCGNTLSPEELIEPRSALSGTKPILKLTKHWFLSLDQYEDWLKTWILDTHTDWKAHVYGQCKSWLEQGLHPRAITRDLPWGIPVPLAEAAQKVLYVWFDAPIGYISATKEWAQAHDRDWKPYWQDPTTQLVHFIGKDNIVFHCLIFPVMLQAHGDFILPKHVPANEFMNLEGKKISTSRNHAVWLPDYLKQFPDQQDVLRYVLCANAPENKDSDFTWQDFQAKNNNELVAIVGNFIHRSLVLLHKYYAGEVPPCKAIDDGATKVMRYMENVPQQITHSIESFKFKEGLNSWIDLARQGNKYLTETEPWHLIKTNPDSVQTILYLATQMMAQLAILGEPFLPFTSQKLATMLRLDTPLWHHATRQEIIPPGTVLQQPVLLFQRIENDMLPIS